MPYISYENLDVVKTTNPWESNKDETQEGQKWSEKRDQKEPVHLTWVTKKKHKILNYGHKWEKRTKMNLPIFSANKHGPTEVHIGWDLCLQPGTPSSSNPPQKKTGG